MAQTPSYATGCEVLPVENIQQRSIVILNMTQTF